MSRNFFFFVITDKYPIRIDQKGRRRAKSDCARGRLVSALTVLSLVLALFDAAARRPAVAFNALRVRTTLLFFFPTPRRLALVHRAKPFSE